MKLGIDLDGVLADFNAAFARLIKDRTGIELSLPPTTWNYHLDGGVTKEQDHAIWGEIAASRSFWASLKPLPSATALIAQLDLLDPAHEVYFITTRPGATAKAQSEVWLRAMGMRRFPTVIVSRRKGLVAAGIELDLMLDDRHENLIDIKMARPECLTIMLRHPYNLWALSDPRIDTAIDMAESVLGYVEDGQ